MAWIVRDAAPKALILEQQYVPIIERLRAEMPSVEHYIVIGGEVPQWASGLEAVLSFGLCRRRAVAAAAAAICTQSCTPAVRPDGRRAR